MVTKYVSITKDPSQLAHTKRRLFRLRVSICDQLGPLLWGKKQTVKQNVHFTMPKEQKDKEASFHNLQGHSPMTGRSPGRSHLLKFRLPPNSTKLGANKPLTHELLWDTSTQTTNQLSREALVSMSLSLGHSPTTPSMRTWPSYLTSLVCSGGK